MSNVIVEYSDFSKDNSLIENITFDLLPEITLILSQSTETDEDGNESKSLSITMKDKETEETEVTGVLDSDTINSLIRSLTIFRSQLSN